MKKLLRIVRWILLILIGIFFIGLIVIGIVGFPKPKSITRSDNVPRIPWKSVYHNFMVTKNFVEGSKLIDWCPDGSGLYLLSKNGFLQCSFSRQSSPDSLPMFLDGMPQYFGAVFINTVKDKDYLILSKDNNGDEQYQLCRFDLNNKSLDHITDGKGSSIGVSFTPDGNKFLYLNNSRNSKYYDFYLVDPQNPGFNKRIFTSDRIGQFPVSFSPVSENIILVNDCRKWTATRLYLLDINSGKTTPLDPGILWPKMKDMV